MKTEPGIGDPDGRPDGVEGGGGVDGTSSRRHPRGFTYVEVLIAFLIAAILTTAVCSTLIVSLRAEREAAWLRQCRFTVQSLVADVYANEKPTDAVAAAYPDWAIDIEEADSRDASGRGVSWEIWRLSPRSRPSLAVTVEFQNRRGDLGVTREWR